ncbi:hypothetical protein PYCCODRAFT_1414740 [Trametes coccinea BRFM310]|uniref:Uncharacterized protein n=1 Tax=Trametes coccinea (strain BRFM310) TaxID=1353009 RepID=A0A1Y2IG52_TRAC3|nr:hypothetical protein PYCCODRAFT_1414740 [Trametes coccinea BRFM310]
MKRTPPIEIIEYTIGFLHGERDALFPCTLLCRELLSFCRSAIWEVLVVFMTEEGLNSPRIASFLDLIRHSPDIAACVRSLTINYQRDIYKSTKQSPQVDAVVAFSRHLPGLRNLTLSKLPSPSLYHLLLVARQLPTLETLNLYFVSLIQQTSKWPPSAPPLGIVRRQGTAGSWALRSFSFTGGLRMAEHSDLVSFLEKSTDIIPLRSFALRVPSLITCSEPFMAERRPAVPNFACNLLHFGISVHEILPLGDVYEGGREHTRRVFSQLHQCQSLRSLELQCDCSSFFWIQSNGLYSHQSSFRLPSFAIAELADTFSSPGAPPCPLLESISIEVIAPQSWLVGWGKDLALLASAITGSDEEGRKRYPRFARFHLRSAVLDLIRPGMGQSAMDYAQLQREVKKEEFLMPMLEPFCRAGLDVEVDVC